MSCTQRESFLTESDVRRKIARAGFDIERAVRGDRLFVPETPARDVVIVGPAGLPDKKGFSTKEGQARMLHDLASIELQALELGLRTLTEFQGLESTPQAFLDDLAAVTASEGEHLQICLDAMEELGFPWGTWPVHVALWQAVSSEDSLLDRLLIVHRHLEGAGLDAGESLLRRLNGLDHRTAAHPVVERIVREEVGHVDFGSRWYREVCRLERLDPATDFPKRFVDLGARIPKRIEKISHDLRKKAGFTDDELAFLEAYRSSIQRFPSKNSQRDRANAIGLPAVSPASLLRPERA